MVVGRVPIPELDNLPILADLERAHGLVRVEVTLPRLGFHHLVGAVGSARVSVWAIPSTTSMVAHTSPGGVESTVDVHSVLRFVL